MPAALCERTTLPRPEVKKFPLAKAFLIMKVKRWTNIGCLSIPLERAPTAAQAQEIIAGILGDTNNMYVSDDKNLFFASAPGLFRGLDSLFDVPQQVLGVSMQSRRREFERETADQFFDSVYGRTFIHAGLGKGAETFPFGYRIKEGHVVGKTLQGEERQVMTLAIDEEHAKLLKFEDDAFVGGPAELTSIEISKHPTVSLCCAIFFKEKFLEKLRELSDPVKVALANFASLFLGSRYALDILQKSDTCNRCGEASSEKHHCGENVAQEKLAATGE